MQTKEFKQLTNRLIDESKQILEDSSGDNHPLHVFGTDQVNLILEFKWFMDIFEWEFPRLCKLVHDHYVSMELIQDFLLKTETLLVNIKPFREEGYQLAAVFDRLMVPGIITDKLRDYLEEISLERAAMIKEGGPIKRAIMSGLKKNEFGTLLFWRKKYHMSITASNRLHQRVVFY